MVSSPARPVRASGAAAGSPAKSVGVIAAPSSAPAGDVSAPPANGAAATSFGRLGTMGLGGLAWTQLKRTRVEAPFTRASSWPGFASGRLSNVSTGLPPSLTTNMCVPAAVPAATVTVCVLAHVPGPAALTRSVVSALAVGKIGERGGCAGASVAGPSRYRGTAPCVDVPGLDQLRTAAERGDDVVRPARLERQIVEILQGVRLPAKRIGEIGRIGGIDEGIGNGIAVIQDGEAEPVPGRSGGDVCPARRPHPHEHPPAPRTGTVGRDPQDVIGDRRSRRVLCGEIDGTSRRGIGVIAADDPRDECHTAVVLEIAADRERHDTRPSCQWCRRTSA